VLLPIHAMGPNTESWHNWIIAVNLGCFAHHRSGQIDAI